MWGCGSVHLRPKTRAENGCADTAVPCSILTIHVARHVALWCDESQGKAGTRGSLSDLRSEAWREVRTQHWPTANGPAPRQAVDRRGQGKVTALLIEWS